MSSQSSEIQLSVSQSNPFDLMDYIGHRWYILAGEGCSRAEKCGKGWGRGLQPALHARNPSPGALGLQGSQPHLVSRGCLTGFLGGLCPVLMAPAGTGGDTSAPTPSQGQTRACLQAPRDPATYSDGDICHQARCAAGQTSGGVGGAGWDGKGALVLPGETSMEDGGFPNRGARQLLEQPRGQGPA